MYRYSGLIISVFLLLALPSCKKDLLHWQKVVVVNADPSYTINNIKFISDNICIAAGGVKYSQSEILRSVDGGYTWSKSSNALAPKQMFGMSISNNGNIYLCGVDGDVLHSNDSGLTWKFNRINNWNVYLGGTFFTPDTGIFVNSVLQRQSTITRVDANFNIIDEQTNNFGLNNVYQVNANTGYVVGYGTVMKTTDRGNTWVFQDVNGDNFMAMDIHGDEIWMCGFSGSVYHTTNGGSSWRQLRNGNDITHPTYNILDIVFKDELNGWAVCDNAKVIHTDDGGNHWAEYDQFTTSSLRSLALCPNGDLLVAGDNGNIFRLTMY